MKKALFKACLLATCLTLVTMAAKAQQRVHALSGTVTSINSKIGMIEIETDDGSSAHFRCLKKSDGEVEFDKSVSADAVSADKFTTKGARVIVYYFGEGDLRTIVALRDLGDGSVAKSIGTVVKLNRRDHVLIIKNSAGIEESFRVDPKTVADTATGVLEGNKFDLSKGDHVHVTSGQASGSTTALLILLAA